MGTIERPRSRRRDLVSVLCAAAVAFTARASLADHYVVPSGSMEPTVAVADRILVNKLAYGLRVPDTHIYLARFGEVARGDVVVLASPQGGTVLLKRVVAVAGDRVQVRSGELEINGAPIAMSRHGCTLYEVLGATPHPVSLDHGGGPDFGPALVPHGHALVMGDNRGNSHDGRAFGFVDESAILGRAVGVFLHGGSFAWTPL